MPKFQVLTLFPELFENFKSVGLISRAVKEGLVTIEAMHLRDFAINTHGQVDDSPYGGGSGMVLRPESALAAITAAKNRDPGAKVVLFTPRGRPLSQELAREVASSLNDASGLILICPRYEGIDERIAQHHVDLEFSIGDFIMMGGEVPAMALMESVIRLIPGVLGNPDSVVTESFENGLLEFPQYTKPQDFQGLTVPDVLLSGNHKEIELWRRAQSWKDTVHRRPDLIRKPVKPAGELSVGLIHHPVVDKQGLIITSSITNLDLHDIARSARTYGLPNFYVVHPVRTLRRLAQKICQHWATGFGATYNPNRSEALSAIKLLSTLDDVIMDIETRTGKLPIIVTTSARQTERSTTFASFRQQLLLDDTPHLLLLGTGWGLAPEVLERAQIHLEPVVGPTEYNHLSVRGAAAIMFDKILGSK